MGQQLERADIPRADVDLAAGYRHMFALIGNGIIQALEPADPYAPTFGAITRTDVLKWGLDCPDCAYRTTAIKGDLNYRITGNIGTVRYLSFQINEGMANNGNIRNDELECASAGSFELFVGPDEQAGNWLATPAGAETIISRQFFADWDNEERADFEIELTSPLPPDTGAHLLVATPNRVARQLDAVGTWLEANAKFWIDVEVLGQDAKPNAFGDATVKSEMGGAQENINAWGHYELGPDEAMIVEAVPALARYWSLHAGNFWWESIDYATRHSSINLHQAVIDDDGVFRAVVAHHDPGVPNWIDTMGHTKGPLLFRWVVADHGPATTTTVVPLADLRDHLPATTGTVTPEERAAVIAKRRRSVQRRFAS
ncbi:hypothetical protein BH24ACT5_BH24ACT5_31810 [soil metagenome]